MIINIYKPASDKHISFRSETHVLTRKYVADPDGEADLHDFISRHVAHFLYKRPNVENVI